MLTKSEFIDACAQTCDNGDFVTPKHSPKSVGTIHQEKRSITCMDNAEMGRYLRLGDFRVNCYSDTKPGNSPQLYTIQPNDPTIVPGSGIPKQSPDPTSACDVFVVPSGASLGWHVYAATSNEIQAQELSGRIRLLCELL
jgi:hypothetical protein